MTQRIVGQLGLKLLAPYPSMSLLEPDELDRLKVGSGRGRPVIHHGRGPRTGLLRRVDLTWRRGRAGAGLVANRGASRTGRRCRPVQTECRIRCRRGGDERGSCRRSDLTGGKHGEWVGVSDEWSKGDPGKGFGAFDGNRLLQNGLAFRAPLKRRRYISSKRRAPIYGS